MGKKIGILCALVSIILLLIVMLYSPKLTIKGKMISESETYEAELVFSYSWVSWQVFNKAKIDLLIRDDHGVDRERIIKIPDSLSVFSDSSETGEKKNYISCYALFEDQNEFEIMNIICNENFQSIRVETDRFVFQSDN